LIFILNADQSSLASEYFHLFIKRSNFEFADYFLRNWLFFLGRKETLSTWLFNKTEKERMEKVNESLHIIYLFKLRKEWKVTNTSILNLWKFDTLEITISFQTFNKTVSTFISDALIANSNASVQKFHSFNCLSMTIKIKNLQRTKFLKSFANVLKRLIIELITPMTMSLEKLQIGIPTKRERNLFN